MLFPDSSLPRFKHLALLRQEVRYDHQGQACIIAQCMPLSRAQSAKYSCWLLTYKATSCLGPVYARQSNLYLSGDCRCCNTTRDESRP